MITRDLHTRNILSKVEAGNAVSQRSLAKDLGIALGLTNLLLRRLVRKGLIRIIRIKPNRVRYLITPTGIAEKARMSRRYFQHSVRFYSETRDRISESFAALSASWPCDNGHLTKRIVFYGGGEVAEIGYVCLADSDLQLVGIVDNSRSRPFFGQRVHLSSDLRPGSLNGQPFDIVVVMSFGDDDVLGPEISACGIPNDRVFWI